jgi:hypothetical protein
VLPIVRGQVQRCRDCKHRFWIGVEWTRVVLGALAAMVVAGVIVAMVLVRQHQAQPARDVPAPQVRRRRFRPLPPGLPPLSSVPSPDSAQSAKGDKKSQ